MAAPGVLGYSADKGEEMTMVSIVMLIGPGRYRLTRQALESLTSHTDRSVYNLTLVMDCDTGSPVDFRTISLARGFADAYGASVLDVRNSGHTLSQLKNLGVAWSEQRFGRGDWLYISDNDVFFTPGWLKQLTEVAELSEPSRFWLWGGQVHPFHQPIDKWHRCMSYMLDQVSVLDGPSWLMRWDTWDKYGPFDRTTAPGVCQSEEFGVCGRLIAGGGRIGVAHPHVVIHTGLTHLDGRDCVGRKERESMIPEGVLAL